MITKKRLYTGIFLLFLYGAAFTKSIYYRFESGSEVALGLAFTLYSAIYSAILITAATAGSCRKPSTKYLLILLAAALVHPALILKSNYVMIELMKKYDVYLVSSLDRLALFTTVTFIVHTFEAVFLGRILKKYVPSMTFESYAESMMRSILFVSLFFHPIIIWYGYTYNQFIVAGNLLIAQTVVISILVYLAMHRRKTAHMISYVAAAGIADLLLIFILI